MGLQKGPPSPPDTTNPQKLPRKLPWLTEKVLEGSREGRPPDNLTPIRKRIRDEGIVRKNLKRLEGGGRSQDTTVTQKTGNRHKTKTEIIDRKQTLLTKYILTKPRASHPASSSNKNTKEDSIPKAEGRGAREEFEEGRGDNVSLGKRPEDGN